MDYLFLLIGLIILVVSGDFLVKGGIQLANHFKISKLIVGVTVISLGTSAPELFVSAGAALNGSPDISIGNIIGSNVANIALVLGITALILPVPIAKDSTLVNWPVMFGATLLLYFLIFDQVLSSLEGGLLLLLLLVYILFLILRSKGEKASFDPPTLPIWKAVAFVILASTGLYFGAELLVYAAQNLALNFGVSERIIGLTVLAFGTSVPELTTSIIAACKKQMDISVGNILGSNIFNILGVLGTTAIIKEIRISNEIIHFDMYWLICLAILLLLTMLPLSKGRINRLEGSLLVSVYFVYTSILFLS